MKKNLLILMGLALVFSVNAKEILVSTSCDRLGCNSAYILTGKDVVPYQKPTREQQLREDLKKEIKWQRVKHAEYGTLTDEQVAVKMLEEVVKNQR